MNRAYGVLCAVAFVLLTGCVGGPSKRSAVMKSVDVKFAPDAQQLRLQTRGLVDSYCGRIEVAADEIIAQARDQQIRRAALVWKTNTIPAMREALFRPDPMAAILDGWALSMQLRNYFDSEDGREVFGEWADFARATMQDLDDDFEAFITRQIVSGELKTGRSFIENWAREHPIDGVAAGCQSMLNQVMLIQEEINMSRWKKS